MSAEWLTADIGWWQSEQAGSEVAMSAAASGRPLEGPWRDPPGPVGEGATPRDPLRGLPAPAVRVHTVCCLASVLWVQRPKQVPLAGQAMLRPAPADQGVSTEHV